MIELEIVRFELERVRLSWSTVETGAFELGGVLPAKMARRNGVIIAAETEGRARNANGTLQALKGQHCSSLAVHEWALQVLRGPTRGRSKWDPGGG